MCVWGEGGAGGGEPHYRKAVLGGVGIADEEDWKPGDGGRGGWGRGGMQEVARRDRSQGCQKGKRKREEKKKEVTVLLRSRMRGKGEKEGERRR